MVCQWSLNGRSDMAHYTPPLHTQTRTHTKSVASDLVATDLCHIYANPADKRIKAGRQQPQYFRETLKWLDLQTFTTIVWFVSNLRQEPSLPTLKTSLGILDRVVDSGKCLIPMYPFPSRRRSPGESRCRLQFAILLD